MSHLKTGLLASLALAGFLTGASGCGSNASSQADARDRATQASCQWLNGCGKIGPSGTYPTLDTCQVQVRANWDSAWPLADCDGKINEAALEVCLQSIALTDCMSGLDQLNTLGTKCPKAKVCSGAKPDGG